MGINFKKAWKGAKKTLGKIGKTVGGVAKGALNLATGGTYGMAARAIKRGKKRAKRNLKRIKDLPGDISRGYKRFKKAHSKCKYIGDRGKAPKYKKSSKRKTVADQMRKQKSSYAR